MEHLEVKISTVVLLLSGVGLLLSAAFVDMFGLSIWVAALLLTLAGIIIKLFNR